MQHSERFWIRSFLLPSTTRLAPIQFAVAVSKKVSPTAVGRNSIKRMVYEIVEKTIPANHAGIGIIVGVKKDLSKVSPADIEIDLSVLLKKVFK